MRWMTQIIVLILLVVCMASVFSEVSGDDNSNDEEDVPESYPQGDINPSRMITYDGSDYYSNQNRDGTITYYRKPEGQHAINAQRITQEEFIVALEEGQDTGPIDPVITEPQNSGQQQTTDSSTQEETGPTLSSSDTPYEYGFILPRRVDFEDPDFGEYWAEESPIDLFEVSGIKGTDFIDAKWYKYSGATGALDEYVLIDKNGVIHETMQVKWETNENGEETPVRVGSGTVPIREGFFTSVMSALRKGSSISSLFYSNDDLREKREKAMRELYDTFGGAIPGTTEFYVDLMCSAKIPKAGNGAAYIEDLDKLRKELELAAFINAEKIPQRIVSENNITGEIEFTEEFIYKIEFSVNTKGQLGESVSFNVRLFGNQTIDLFDQMIKVDDGQENSRTGKRTIIQRSKNNYERLCLIFTNGIQVRDGSGFETLNELCNTIVEVTDQDPTVLERSAQISSGSSGSNTNEERAAQVVDI